MSLRFAISFAVLRATSAGRRASLLIGGPQLSNLFLLRIRCESNDPRSDGELCDERPPWSRSCSDRLALRPLGGGAALELRCWHACEGADPGRPAARAHGRRLRQRQPDPLRAAEARLC